jgi:hypothetical protein
MDFGWNESGPRMDPNGTKVKHKWNVNGILVGLYVEAIFF